MQGDAFLGSHHLFYKTLAPEAGDRLRIICADNSEGLVKDLGVDSAGARRRRVATSNARLQKAVGRSRKLGRLEVSVREKGLGGFRWVLHCCWQEEQGLAPKRMKVLRRWQEDTSASSLAFWI